MSPNGFYNGWGIKYRYYGIISIGWWKNRSLNGNSIILNKDWTVKQNGWFKDGFYKGPMKIDVLYR